MGLDMFKSPFECLCGNFILPEFFEHVYLFALFFFLRKILYLIFLRRGGIWGLLRNRGFPQAEQRNKIPCPQIACGQGIFLPLCELKAPSGELKLGQHFLRRILFVFACRGIDLQLMYTALDTAAE